MHIAYQSPSHLGGRRDSAKICIACSVPLCTTMNIVICTYISSWLSASSLYFKCLGMSALLAVGVVTHEMDL